MRHKLLLLLLLIPELLCAQYSCSRLQLPGWWGDFDYLLMWRRKRFYPPLVTTSPVGTPPANAGVLGFPSTSILFGDEEVGRSPQSGGRVDAGVWLGRCLGLGASWFKVADETHNFRIDSDLLGIPIIARPFFNVDTDMEDARLVAYPFLFGPGEVEVKTRNYFWGTDAYFRTPVLSVPLKLDVLGGFMFTRLADIVEIRHTTIIDPFGIATEEDVFDSFKARNSFYAGMVGVVAELRSNCWGLYVMGKVGFGNMVKNVEIIGKSIETTNGTVILGEGMLALPSNIGTHFQNGFEVVPQVNAALQFKLWPPCWLQRNYVPCPPFWLSIGYMGIYWPRVLLAGEQIDLNISPSQATLDPVFSARNRSFWAHGLSVGIYVFF